MRTKPRSLEINLYVLTVNRKFFDFEPFTVTQKKENKF